MTYTPPPHPTYIVDPIDPDLCYPVSGDDELKLSPKKVQNIRDRLQADLFVMSTELDLNDNFTSTLMEHFSWYRAQHRDLRSQIRDLKVESYKLQQNKKEGHSMVDHEADIRIRMRDMYLKLYTFSHALSSLLNVPLQRTTFQGQIDAAKRCSKRRRV